MPGLLDYTVLPGIFGGGFPLPARNVGAINPQPLALPFNANPPTAAMVAAAHPQSGFQRLVGALGEAFGGPRDPMLSDEQNSGALRQAVLQAGLGMLAASGPSTEPRSLGQIIAAGAGIGQQAGGAARQAELARSQREAMRQTVARIAAQGMGPEQLQQLFVQALMNNDSRAATAIATVIQSVEAAGAKGKQGLRAFKPGDMAYDDATHQFIQVPGGKPEGPKPITRLGREFPDTPQGVKDALAWVAANASGMRAPSAASAPKAPKTPVAIASAKAEANATQLISNFEAGGKTIDDILKVYDTGRANWDEEDARTYKALLAEKRRRASKSTGNPAAAAAAAAAKGGQ